MGLIDSKFTSRKLRATVYKQLNIQKRLSWEYGPSELTREPSADFFGESSELRKRSPLSYFIRCRRCGGVGIRA